MANPISGHLRGLDQTPVNLQAQPAPPHSGTIQLGALRLDRVGWVLSAGGWVIRSIWVFCRFAANPPIFGLDFLGFPWILSSES
jgi:hypothetical protein